MMNIQKRSKCIICDGSQLNDIITLQDMPLFMGTSTGEEAMFSDMTFSSCDNCSNIQIKELIDPNILYARNHNLNVVGELWDNHYKSFIDFLGNDTKDKTVLEIGDPSCKISTKASPLSKKWLVVEINPDHDIPKPEKVEYIEKFFDNTFTVDEDIDVVIHSHLLEHITNPIEHLNLIHDLLVEEGRLIFSVPNLGGIVESGQSPNAALHFEHTYFFNLESMVMMLNNCGFKVIDIEEYRNHSLFIHCVKDEKVPYDFDKLKMVNQQLAGKFRDNFNHFVEKVRTINYIITGGKKVYLYGCHVSSQFLLNIGLKEDSVSTILDNSEAKQLHLLYGTQLATVSPYVIVDKEAPIIIASHMSIYYEEIKNQILALNKTAIIL